MNNVYYHYSEEPGIDQFIPRKNSTFPDLQPVVWAIDKEHAPLYYFPRDCPRIAIWRGNETSELDMNRFQVNIRMVITIEKRWLQALEKTIIHEYSFAGKTFQCFDENAGYYISQESVEPIEVTMIDNLPEKLLESNVELRLVNSLKSLRDDVLESSLAYSMIRMRNAILA
ncbi:DUF6886 family protein [Alkalihalobacillus sp. AL-G]|uniref:DUF6886 family protein n=1 Tax=Alkalihalobacillus sp. AL-G TaxID=2926399 RepID=UPI0027297470|nr:DUF6886 family protein [Alkalihalobacillus sp. AL-G]WLD93237.1 hypothetical protein MOJ78_19945 [Alkalihalobacillus sp. AL-G]